MKDERHPTRRTVLKGMAAGLALSACKAPDSGGDPLAPDAGTPADAPGPTLLPETLAESAQFPLGVAAGDLAADRAIVWTRYGGAAALALYAWRMDGDAYVEELGPFAVAPANGGFAHVAVSGLVAGARYRYAFVELAGEERVARSRIGRFRAPIADTASEPITFGAVACTEHSRPATVLARAAERADLDAFVFVGDNAYCDGATTLPEYRAKYDSHFGRADHAAIRAQTGMYITWDDHEVKNDWNPETINSAQLDAAFQAFFDHAAIARVAGAERRIWRSSRWGRTVEVFVLDCRSERKPSTLLSGAHQYISAEQLAWLKAGLAASQATFKLIVNSVPITDMPNVWDAYPTDRWEAYRNQRLDILRFIDESAITGVVWLAGDFHLAFISKVSTSGPGASQREVLAGPGGQSANALLPSLQKPQFAYATGTNNYTTLRFDPASREVTVGYHNAAGVMFHSESFIP
jgi:alkaline phosphatase D